MGPTQKPSRPISPWKAKPRGGERTAIGPKGHHYEFFIGICVGRFKSYLGRYRPGRISQGDAQKEFSDRQVIDKSTIFRGSVWARFKSHLGRYRPGRLSQREVKKELSIRKVQNATIKGSVKARFKNLLGRCLLGRLSQREVQNAFLGRLGPGSFRIGAGQAAKQISTYDLKGGSVCPSSHTHTAKIST